MEKDETTEEYDHLRKFIDLHPKYLEALKDVYPLAVLGSLCIAIAAFSVQSYLDAVSYSITAASLYLLAFVVSFIFKIQSNYLLALISYVSTALGTIYLFLVIKVFAFSVLEVSKSLVTIISILCIIILSSLAYTIYRIQKRKKFLLNILQFVTTLSLAVYVDGIFSMEILELFDIHILDWLSNTYIIPTVSSLSLIFLF